MLYMPPTRDTESTQKHEQRVRRSAPPTHTQPLACESMSETKSADSCEGNPRKRAPHTEVFSFTAAFERTRSQVRMRPDCCARAPGRLINSQPSTVARTDRFRPQAL
eukprot:3746642-Prymnesium_polylepis.1